MVLVPPWRRPSEGASLGNHEARIRALERAQPKGRGHYIFVEEIELGPGSGSFTFTVPQDARHLKIEVECVGSDCKLRFNGDFTSHYHTIESRLNDNDGTLTRTDTISGVTDGIDLECLNTDVYAARAVIQIPYYRAFPADEFSRSAEVEAWSITGQDDPHQWTHWQVAGWWYVDNTPRPAITSVTINALSGIAGLASLYKVM